MEHKRPVRGLRASGLKIKFGIAAKTSNSRSVVVTSGNLENGTYHIIKMHACVSLRCTTTRRQARRLHVTHHGGCAHRRGPLPSLCVPTCPPPRQLLVARARWSEPLAFATVETLNRADVRARNAAICVDLRKAHAPRSIASLHVI